MWVSGAASLLVHSGDVVARRDSVFCLAASGDVGMSVNVPESARRRAAEVVTEPAVAGTVVVVEAEEDERVRGAGRGLAAVWSKMADWVRRKPWW